MSSAVDRDKALPAIPVDIDVSETIEDIWIFTIPTSKSATFDAHKLLPRINVEDTLSEDDMRLLHELWNEAGLSARAHRMKRRDQNPAPRRIPAPISIPDPADVPPTFPIPSADLSIASAASTTGTRKRRFLGTRPFSETQETEKKTSKALEKLLVIAQDRLKKKLKYAKSTPNLGDKAAPLRRSVTSRPAAKPTAAVRQGTGACIPRDLAPPRKTTEAIVQQDDMDENAIYFTVDPNWRASQGSAQFECITPVPDSSPEEGIRPDSPLLHRHHSLDQLSFAAQRATRSSTVVAFPETPSRDDVLDAIDELSAYLEEF